MPQIGDIQDPIHGTGTEDIKDITGGGVQEGTPQKRKADKEAPTAEPEQTSAPPQETEKPSQDGTTQEPPNAGGFFGGPAPEVDQTFFANKWFEIAKDNPKLANDPQIRAIIQAYLDDLGG
jgi:hypothetical protein